MRRTAGRFIVPVIAFAVAVVTACSDDGGKAPRDRTEPVPSSPSSSAPAADAGSASTSHLPSPELRRCAVGRRALTSIEDAVARLGMLAPADGPCFVAALPRPLSVVGTIGSVSAQPADGAKSPRLFFLLPNLVVSAVPSGPGAELLEFGEWVTPTRTLKGEIALPVTAPLAPDAAFKKVLDQQNSGTLCRACHRDEERHATIANGFVSAAFQPEPGQAVSVAELSKLHDTCTRDNDKTARCTMLHAVFDFGQLVQGEFDPDVGTFLLP